MAIQGRISRAQHDETRFGWVFPVQEHHQTQAPLQRLMPHHGGLQVQMRRICSWAKVLEPAQVLEVDLPIILPPCPTALRVRTSIEKHAVSVAPQFGDGVQIEADDFINIFLLRIVAVYTVIFDARRQAMPMRMQLLLIEVDPCLFLRRLRGLLTRRRLRDGQGKAHQRVTSTTASVDISSPRSARLAQPLKKCPSPNVCLPLLGRKDASCAETSSARGSSAIIRTC